MFIEGDIDPLFPRECYFENQNSNLYFYRHSTLIFLRENSLQRRTLFKNITSFPTHRRLCIKIYQWAIKNTLLHGIARKYTAFRLTDSISLIPAVEEGRGTAAG